MIDRILQKEGHLSLNQIYKGFPLDVKNRIKEFVGLGSAIMQDAIWPIEVAIHDFAVELLKGLKSAYILNNEAEVERLKKEVEKAVRAIQAYQGQDQDKRNQAGYERL